ncbi:MAG: hypothetical protein ACLTB5_03450 [Acutalibacteraceae bacterium]
MTEVYEDMLLELAELSRSGCRYSPTYEELLGTKQNPILSRIYPNRFRKESKIIKNVWQVYLYFRCEALYNISYVHCCRSLVNGQSIENILATAQDTALSLLDTEDPFGNVGTTTKYIELQEEFRSYDFSDLQKEVITRILLLTADIIREQTYLSALLYYMGHENCLHLLDELGILHYPI